GRPRSRSRTASPASGASPGRGAGRPGRGPTPPPRRTTAAPPDGASPASAPAPSPPPSRDRGPHGAGHRLAERARLAGRSGSGPEAAERRGAHRDPPVALARERTEPRLQRSRGHPCLLGRETPHDELVDHELDHRRPSDSESVSDRSAFAY